MEPRDWATLCLGDINTGHGPPGWEDMKLERGIYSLSVGQVH
jgi:hypothetical protein